MLTVNTAAGHRGPALVGHGVLKANGGDGGGAYRVHKGRKWMVELEKYAFGWIQSAQEKEGERLVYLGKVDRRDFNLGLEKEKKMR